VLVRNGILLTLLNVTDAVKDRCFEAVFITTSKVLASFGRRIGVRSKKTHIGSILYLWWRVGYE
jgi:hypothetical protein